MNLGRILLVDDDRSLLRALRIGLSARGYDIVEAQTGSHAVEQVSLTLPDVVVLDLGLPDIDGLEVCRRIREWNQVPVIILSASGQEETKVAVLDAGADDYVTKPFGMAELEARVRAALRRRSIERSDSSADPNEMTIGPLSLDLVHRMATANDNAIDLTSREFEVLAFLVRHAGKTCTHQMILHSVWGPGFAEESHYLRVYIHRLRQKMGACGSMVRTRQGIGYELIDADLSS